jgi:hypothetical protein
VPLGFFICGFWLPRRGSGLSATIMSEGNISQAFMPYPVSTLSPRIIPTDLSSFKSRGISEVERELQQKLTEIREEYLAAIDHFNWNKLIYEADINFEPIIGQTYHLYEVRNRKLLSMIGPEQWHHKHLATVRLNIDRQWKLEQTASDIDSQQLFGAALP